MRSTPPESELRYYAAPGPMTTFDPEQAAALSSLPAGVPSLVTIVQGVLVHRAWQRAYQLDLPPERLAEEQLHSAAAMVRRIHELQDAPLDVARRPALRMAGICRHFATLLCALLRHSGIPARARCGFATYFEPGKHVDHWVCEYWNSAEQRWVMVDAQIDAVQRAVLKLDFDPLDVPPERFLTGGRAWLRCRAGEADPSLFGIFDMWGLGFVRGDLRLDVASLNKIELLPWDHWPPMGTFERPPDEDLDLMDGVAALSVSDDPADIAALRKLYETAPGLRAPDELLARVTDAAAAGAGAGPNPLVAGS
jgi:hypothetical protein